MIVLRIAVVGFVATLVLTTLLAGSQGLGLSRINLPYLLGTAFTANRDRAKLYGIVIHFLNGWVFSIIYAVVFYATGGSSWWRGLIGGAIHALFVLVVGMSSMPALHPRMANEQQGPTVTRRLEPPGFLGLHYGYQTPLSIFVAHMVFGLLLGAFFAIPAQGA